MKSPASIDIRIDALEVEGLSQAEASRFRQDVERELARLVREQGLPSISSGTRSLVEVEAGSKQRDRAASVAGAIYRALGR